MSLRRRYPFLFNFIPFGLLVVAAYLGLAQFRKIEYTHNKKQVVLYKDQLRKLGVSEEDYSMQAAMSRDEEIKEMLEKTANAEWSNVRGPRPWEDNVEFNEAMKKREEQKKKAKLEQAK
jgi:hypothetical protein